LKEFYTSFNRQNSGYEVLGEDRHFFGISLSKLHGLGRGPPLVSEDKAMSRLLLKKVRKSTQGTPGCTRSLWHFCAPKKEECVRKQSAWIDDGSSCL